MRKTIFSLALILLLTSANARAGEQQSSIEIFLNNYFQQLAVKQVEMILPPGKFALSATVTLNERKLKSDSSGPAVGAGIRLPLGHSMITAAELKSVNMNSSETADRLLSYVTRIDVKLSLNSATPSPVRAMITSAIDSALALKKGRGDSITFVDLPEGFGTAWISPADKTASEQLAFQTKLQSTLQTSLQSILQTTLQSSLKWALIFGGSLALVFLLGIGILFQASRQLTGSLSTEARNISAALKESAEAQSGGAPAWRQSPTAGESVKSEATLPNEFWDKVDDETLRAFAVDCQEHPRYSSVPSVLVNTLLGPDKAAELEKRFSEETLQASKHAGQNLSASEVTALFQSNQAEYRRSTRSPVSRQLRPISVTKLLPFVESLEKVEAALLVNSLTPLRRGALLKMVSAQFKIAMAAATAEQRTAVQHKAFEYSLTDKVSKLAGPEEQETGNHSLDYLSQMILKSSSFEEDEALYFHSLALMSGQGQYHGVLRVLTLFGSEDWASANLQDAAVAFSGYSTRIKSALLEKISGKRQEWMRAFLTKAESGNLDFTSPEVVAAQEAIGNKIREKFAAQSGKAAAA